MLEEVKTCRFCQTECDYYDSVCRKCGRPFNDASTVDYVQHEQEQFIDDISITEASVYVGPNAARYTRIWTKQHQTGRKRSWNWSAFFFPPYWMLYRKMYAEALIYFAVVSVISIISGFIPIAAYDNFVENATTQSLNNLFRVVSLILLITLVPLIALVVLIGIYADWLYFNSMKRRYKYKSGSTSGASLAVGIITVYVINMITTYVFQLFL